MEQNFHVMAFYKPHLYQPLSEGAVTENLYYYSFLTGGQFIQSHSRFVL